MTSFAIQNSVAFVTGTNKKNGIGRAIVQALINSGAAKVYATARDAAQLDELVAEHNGKVVAVSLDVTDLEAVQALPEQYPDVTLLVNNAGVVAAKSSLDDVSLALKEIQVNYLAPMAVTKAFAPVLERAESSAVVNVNSIASLVNFPIAGPYSASKAAAHSLTQAQRRDMSKSLVVGVYPGPIDTAMAEEFDLDKTPPSVVAQAVVDALKDGTEDVYPDPMAVQLHEGWQADAKAVEQQMAQSVAA
jgi:NAD(P)-dependent dehydrogenase (short-subunit alcohol dehydrogenase family)